MALDINIIYGSSANSAPAAFKNTIAAAVQFLESRFTDPIKINIQVGYGEAGGQPLGSSELGESLTYLNRYTYAQLNAALNADATSVSDKVAASSLPGADPTGGGHFWMATAQAKAIGLAGGSANLDGYVGFNSRASIFDYDTSNGVSAGQYDFFGVVIHELTEIMGRQLLAGGAIGTTTNSYEPLDLFHYSAPLIRDFSQSIPGYLSLNGGVSNFNDFNTIAGGDAGDWASSAGNDAYRAFSPSGVANPVTATDLTELDILGWNSVVVPAAHLAPFLGMTTAEQQTEAMYVAYFGRAGDPVGVSFWMNVFNSGATILDVALNFALQNESKDLYPFLRSPGVDDDGARVAFIGAIYSDLFNRAPDPGGLAFWDGVLRQDQLTTSGDLLARKVGEFVLDVMGGARGSDVQSILNKVGAASYFTEQVQAHNVSYTAAVDQQAHEIVANTTSTAFSLTTENLLTDAYVLADQATSPETVPLLVGMVVQSQDGVPVD